MGSWYFIIRYLYNYNELHQTRIISERGDDTTDTNLNDATHIKKLKPERKIKMENNNLYASMSFEIDRLKQEIERLHIERGDYGFLGNPSCRGIYAMDLDVNAMKDNLTATEFDILRNFNIGMPKATILIGLNAINKLINMGIISDPMYNGPFFPRQDWEERPKAPKTRNPYVSRPYGGNPSYNGPFFPRQDWEERPKAPKTRNPYVSRPYGGNPSDDNDLIDKLLNSSPSTLHPYNGEVIELTFTDEKTVDEVHEKLQGKIDYIDNNIILNREHKTMTVCVESLIEPSEVTPIITKVIEDMIVRGRFKHWNSKNDSTTGCDFKTTDVSDVVSTGCQFNLNGSPIIDDTDTTETETKTKTEE